MITQEQYNELRARYDRMEQWRKKHGSIRVHVLADNPQIPPQDCRISNDEISALEIYEFTQEPPLTYFAYLYIGKNPLDPNNVTITTFMGDSLGVVTYLRDARKLYAPNGGLYTLQSFDMTGINGLKYYGRAYPYSGDYCRLRAYKHQ